MFGKEGDPLYTGQLVLLRSFDAGDLNALYSYLNDAETMGLVTDGAVMPATMEDTAEWMRNQPYPSGGVYQFAVETLSDGRFIGRCGFVQIDRKNRHGEIAIHLGDRRSRGKGLGSDAVRVLCRLGFQELGLHRIWARCFSMNPACMGCLEKCGFRREGVLRQALYRRDAWHDIYVYGLLKEEWEGSAPGPGLQSESKGALHP